MRWPATWGKMAPMDDLITLARAIPLSFAALLPVVNPLGTAIILLGLTEGVDDAQRRRIARSVAFNSALLLTASLVAGRMLLGFFGISVPIVQVAGGLVLAAMGWTMLLSPDDSTPDPKKVETTASGRMDYGNQAFYPFTFPLTVGPGCIAVAITLSAHTSRVHPMDTVASQLGAFVGIVAVAVAIYFSLANAGRIAGRLGPSGMPVLMRLSAFIVVCLGAEICWNGAKTLFLALTTPA
jgi:multiple antibiotic resistance protein